MNPINNIESLARQLLAAQQDVGKFRHLHIALMEEIGHLRAALTKRPKVVANPITTRSSEPPIDLNDLPITTIVGTLDPTSVVIRGKWERFEFTHDAPQYTHRIKAGYYRLYATDGIRAIIHPLDLPDQRTIVHCTNLVKVKTSTSPRKTKSNKSKNVKVPPTFTIDDLL